MATCKGKRADGEDCGTVFGLSPEGYCVFHDPDRAELMRDARVKGQAGQVAAKRARREKAMLEGMPPDVRVFDKNSRVVPSRVPKPPRNTEEAKKYARWLIDVTARGRMDASTSREVKGALSAFTTISEKRDLELALKDAEKELKRLRAEMAQNKGPRLA